MSVYVTCHQRPMRLMDLDVWTRWIVSETAIIECEDNRGDVSQAVDVIGKLRLS